MMSRRTENRRVVLEFDTLPQRRNGGAANRHVRDLLARDSARYLEHLRYLGSIRDEFYQLSFDPDPSAPMLPNWNNGFFPGLDVVSLHGFLLLNRPKRYVEIGSGNSTKIARRAIDRHGLGTHITSIDPQPRSEIDKICDRVVRQGLENCDLAEIESLEAGDIFFLDGSHRAFMSSDVTVFFLEILPVLKPGVWVHIHDICLPYDYPGEWADRCYSEQYLLACALLYGGDRLRVELPCAFLSWDPEMAPAFSEFWSDPRLSLVRERHGASFWLQIAG